MNVDQSHQVATTLPEQLPDPGEGARVDRKARETLGKLSDLGEEAVSQVEDILRTGTHKLKLAAAFGIMDRIGANRTEQLKLEAAKRETNQFTFVIGEDVGARLLGVLGKRVVSGTSDVEDAQVITDDAEGS